MKTLLESESPGAKKAIEYFVYQIVKYAGAYAAALGGLDALVFTAGIGEKAPVIRKAVCDKIEFLGVELDESRNSRNEILISADSSKVSVFAIPTNEELMIAIHTSNLLQANNLI